MDPCSILLRRSSLWVLLALASGLTACPTRGSINAPSFSDGGAIDDQGQVIGADAPPLGPPCAPITRPARVDPCPDRARCGVPSSARVQVSGARVTTADFQVKLTLPAAIRTAAGAACDRLMFRTQTNQWVPHFVTDCAAGEVWIRVPEIAAGGTSLTLSYGGATALPGAASFDEVFDRVPLRAADLVAAYTFDEATGTRTCPAAGTIPFDAFVHDRPHRTGSPEVTRLPDLWSREAPLSPLSPANPAARFTRNQASLNFPRSDLNRDPMNPSAPRIDRLVNWRSESNAPFKRLTERLTVGLWVYDETPANEFEDNFQTVICFGMPFNPTPPFPGARLDGISIFNPWAIFFRSDDADNSFLQGNTCVFPCINVDQYAHITTRMPFTRAQFTRRWHFAAMTFDATTRPHATRRSYFDDRVYEFPADLDAWPQERYCVGGVCRYPPDTPIYYYDAPIVIGSDMNSGEARLGLEGKVDDLFIIGRSVSPDELRAYRERRVYSADPIVATVIP